MAWFAIGERVPGALTMGQAGVDRALRRTRRARGEDP